MRRTVREAMVGFSLLAAVAAGLGLWFWLKGISLARNTWTIQASFADAAGLASRSPVAYRGVQVGRVRSLRVTDREVVADLEITDPNLRLARPVLAMVGASSLLGGDAMVSLQSGGRSLAPSGPGPLAPGCDDRRLVCDRGRVRGGEAPTLETVTATMQKLLDQADRDGLVSRMARATDSFEKTADETRKLSRQGQLFLGDAGVLIRDLNGVVGQTDPIVRNLKAASLDARSASRSAKQLAERLDNPQAVTDLQVTLAQARRLTQRWEAVGGDVQKLTGDSAFLDGMRSVSVGLGRFFDDLYPAERPRSAERPGSGERPAAASPAPGQRLPSQAHPTGSGQTNPAGSGQANPAGSGQAADSTRPLGPGSSLLPPVSPARSRWRDPSDRFAPRIKAPAMPVPAYGFGPPAR
jgi:phospholipid/cholesterol/gamma-HCH transport system substrate-binding protein